MLTCSPVADRNSQHRQHAVASIKQHASFPNSAYPGYSEVELFRVGGNLVRKRCQISYKDVPGLGLAVKSHSHL